MRVSSRGGACTDRRSRARFGAIERALETLGGKRFEQIVGRLRVEGAHGVLIVGGDEDHGRLGVDQLEHLEAIELRHLDVEENKVGRKFVDGLDGFEAVAALGRDFDFGMGGKEFAKIAARQFFVVDENRAPRHAIQCSAG